MNLFEGSFILGKDKVDRTLFISSYAEDLVVFFETIDTGVKWPFRKLLKNEPGLVFVDNSLWLERLGLLVAPDHVFFTRSPHVQNELFWIFHIGELFNVCSCQFEVIRNLESILVELLSLGCEVFVHLFSVTCISESDSATAWTF